jgi:hypothetical protein
MSNLQAIVNLKSPSEAYFEATCSLVYRLSELMFGSLLAAYSLGFVGALAAHGSELYAHGFWGIILLTAQYASISITFAYLTTSFYLTYHVGILTMPQLPFDRLGIDFTIAIIQAVFFGLSMLQPALFPVLLGINFYISAKRKDKEYERLADRLYDIRPVNARSVTAHKSLFRQELAKLMQDKEKFPKLSDWAPTGIAIRIGAWTAVIIGLTVIGLYLLLDRQNSPPFGTEWLPNKWFLQQLLIAAEVVCATVIITIRGSKVLERRASFLGFPIKDPTQDRPTMDTEFDMLKLELEKLCNKLFGAS